MEIRELRAKLTAAEHHEGQKYGGYDYFSYHIKGVVQSLKSCGYDSDYIIVAYLHDILEDTDCSEDLIKHLFGQEVLDSVIAITKDYFGAETRAEYINRCGLNKIANIVKIHDATFNMLNCIKEGNTRRSVKYGNVIQKLVALQEEIK